MTGLLRPCRNGVSSQRRRILWSYVKEAVSFGSHFSLSVFYSLLSVNVYCMISTDFHTRYFFGLLFLVGVAAALLLWPFFSAIVVAGVLAVLFQGVYGKCMRVTRGGRGASSGLVCLLVALIIILPMISLVGIAVTEIKTVYVQYFSSEELLAQRIDSADALLRSLGFPVLGEGFLGREQLLGKLEQVGTFALGVAQALYIGTTQFIFWLFVMFFTLFYFLMDGKVLVSRAMRLSPLADARERELIRTFESMGRAILKGSFLIGVIQGALGGFFLAIAGFSSPFLWGVVMVVCSLIPFLGSGAVLIPAFVWAFFTGDMFAGGVVLFGFAFISLIDNYLRPRLIGKDAAMHPLLVFFSTLGGLAIFGVSGFLIGPIIMALFLSLLTIYERQFGEELGVYNGGREA